MTLIPKQPIHLPAPRFGAMDNPKGYNPVYTSPYRHYNGVQADTFALATAQAIGTDPAKIRIWDIGAGNGRNSIPLAQAGYQVVASELSDTGLAQIKRRAEEAQVTPNITATEVDILAEPSDKTPSNIDLGLLVHVTQHFHLAELKKALAHIAHSLKKQGYVLFDALIRKPGHEWLGPDDVSVRLGTAHFKQSDIVQVLDELGCTAEVFDYQEPPASQGEYVQIKEWGGQGGRTPFPPREVQLKWFLARKKE